MNGWVLLQDAAWAISAIILVWMAIDMIRTDRRYDEDFLTSSREGELETAEHEQEVRSGHV